MQQRIPFLFVLVLAAALLPAHAARWTANPEQPLQPVLDRAAAGDEVVLPPGHYSGAITIEQPLTLIGMPGAVLDAEAKGTAVRVRAPHVRLEGLSIRNWGRDLTAMDAGIFVEAAAEAVHIEANHLQGAAFGIWLDGAPNARVIGNRIQGLPELRSQDRGNGVHLFNVRNAQIVDNEIWQVRDGIYIEVSNQNLLRGNRMRDLRYGVHYMYSFDNHVVGNYTTGTRTGYALMQSKRLTVVGNRSENDQNYGILLNNITHSTLRDNHVESVRQGSNPGGAEISGAEGKALFVYNAQFNEFIDNRFADSDIGIHLTAGSEDNVIVGNAFVGNYKQVKYVATREQEWSRDGRGNYWSDYLGWDLDGDGRGDVPHEPNDAVDQLLWRYPSAKLLMHSPAVQVLRRAKRQFPGVRPPGVQDSHPLMSEPRRQEYPL